MKQLTPLALALLLTACTTMGGPYGPNPGPPPYPGPPMSAPYHAIGTEPGWSLDIDARSMRFSGPYGQGPVEEATPPVIHGFAGEIYQGRRINVNIVHGRCSDGMSDRSYPDKVQLNVDGKAYTGCGGGSDRPGMPGTVGGVLADSHWRVAAVNGRATPDLPKYRMDFTVDRVSAGFGCNGMGGAYKLDRDMLSAGPMMGTKMFCGEPAQRFESQGSAVLNMPVRVRFSPGRATLTNNAGVIELERR